MALRPRINNVQLLPLELIRHVFSFCPADEIILNFPRVSKRFLAACNDGALLRNCFVREFNLHTRKRKQSHRLTASDASNTGFENEVEGLLLSENIMGLLEISCQRSLDLHNYWSRWTIALQRWHNSPRLNDENISDFTLLIHLMQYLPHLMVLELPLLYSAKERTLLIETLSYFFLDISGGPGFRSRLYSRGLDGKELNLRMALSLTALILKRENTEDLVRKVFHLGDQSIAGWIGSAIIGSVDYMRLRNFESSAIQKRALASPFDFFPTIMGIAVSLLVRHQDGEDLILPPKPENIPLFQGLLDMSSFPVPFDIYPEERKWTDEKKRGFKECMAAQRMQFVKDEEISKGSWCGVYLIAKPFDVREFVFGFPLRDVKFHTTKIDVSTWNIKSDIVEDMGEESFFDGTIRWESHFTAVTLVRTMENGINQHWHGQLSALGMSGGFYYQDLDDGRTFDGGLFWLWKEEWM